MAQFSTSGTSSESKGWEPIDKGRYHFTVTGVQDETGNKASPRLVVECEVLNGESPGMKGRKHTEFFNISDNVKTVERILKLAVAIGLYTKQQWDADAAAERNADFDFETNAIGRQFVGKISHKPHDGKVYGRLNYDIWPVTADEAKGTPVDTEMLAMIGVSVSGAPAQQQSAPVNDDIAAGF